MSSLVIEIVAHAKRELMARELAETVQADRVWLDAGYHGEWRNHLRAWQHAASSGASHAVVLQDDAVPVDGFRELVQQAVEHQPNQLISLYVGTHRPWKGQVLTATKLADEKGASWLRASSVLWGVGLLLPVTLIPEMLEGCCGLRLPYDQRIGAWCENTYRSVFYTWPSLVNHADTETVAHAGMDQGVRVAHRVGAPNWSDVVVDIISPANDKIIGSKRDK